MGTLPAAIIVLSTLRETGLSSATLQDVLKPNPHLLASLNSMKNHVGSAIAGALGGFNAQTSNIVSALSLPLVRISHRMSKAVSA